MSFFKRKSKAQPSVVSKRGSSEQQSTSLSPSSEMAGRKSSEVVSQQPKKKKKEGYKKRMMKKYGLTDKEYEAERKQAHEQLKAWETHKKEQAIKIFESKSSYISKSAKSDLVHPSVGRSKKVMNAAGKMVDVEFGKVKEHYLYSLAPNKQFVEIRTQTAHEQALNPLREKQRRKNSKIDKNKQSDKSKLQAEYANVKNLTTGDVNLEEQDATGDEPSAANDDEPKAEIPMVTNSTDEKHELFTPAWYRLAISRSQISKGKMTYWMAQNEDDVAYDDDPEGKWTVTADKVIESIQQSRGQLKDSGVVEPTGDAKFATRHGIVELWDRYKKSCSREMCYTNTLKGTIDFAIKGRAYELKNAKSGIISEPPTEPIIEISFPTTVTTFVFRGKKIVRQPGGKPMKKVEKFEEPLLDIRRENREEEKE